MLQDFTINIVYNIKGAFSNLIAYINIIIIYLKDFSSSLRDNNLLKLGKQLITSTKNVCNPPFPRSINSNR
jgi:hypothetical protein